MQKRTLNVLSTIIIIISAIVIIKSIVSIYKNKTSPSLFIQTEKPNNDPLTEIAFNEELRDAGDLSRDTIIYQNYTIRNIGNNPLIVYHVSPDCNCTDYDLSQRIALPGDSTIIRLTISTKGKQVGMFMLNTVIKVNTNKQFYRLRLIGNVTSGK